MGGDPPPPPPPLTTKREELSLGWLTESAVMPKKHRAIEGVSASSIVELKAQLYRTQEEVKKDKSSSSFILEEFHRAKKRVLPHDVFSVKNSGVDSRSKKDKLELKAENDGSKSYAALEKKAELYEKLARGELPDEEEKEKYCVDFFRKSVTQEESEQPESQETRDALENGGSEADDNVLLNSKPLGPGQTSETVNSDEHKLNSKPLGPGQTSETVNSDEHKRFVREVHEEANQARHKVTTAKLRRQEQEAARREKLRQAYLRKQLEKLTSSRKDAIATINSVDAANSEASRS